MQSTTKFLPIGDFYEISSNGLLFATERVVFCKGGQVRTKKRAKIATRYDKDGYITASIYFSGKQKHCRVHRLVGIAYIPNPENKPHINHKNGEKSDNRHTNLEWATQSENERHAIKYLGKKQPKGKDSVLSKKIVVTFPNGENKIMYGQNEIARELGLDQSAIWRVLQNQYAQTKGFKFKYA